MGSQSAEREDSNGGRAAMAFRPSAVSWMPRRKRYPAIKKAMLPRNGMRHPQVSTSAADIDALMIHAVPEPRMNPMVVPAAVELLTSPRSSGDAASVVYTIEPVNSPPSENP